MPEGTVKELGEKAGAGLEVVQELDLSTRPPFVSVPSLAEELDLDYKVTKKAFEYFIGQLDEDEDPTAHRITAPHGQNNHPTLQYSQSLADKVRSAHQSFIEDDSVTPTALEAELGVSRQYIKGIGQAILEEHPELEHRLGGPFVKKGLRFSRPVVDMIKANLNSAPRATEDESTTKALATELHVANETIKKVAAKYADDMPDQFVDRRSRTHRTVHYRKELADRIRSDILGTPSPQEGEITNNALADELDIAPQTLESISSKYTVETKGLLVDRRNNRGHIIGHYTSDFADKLRQEVNSIPVAEDNELTIPELAKILGVRAPMVWTVIGHLSEEYPNGLVKRRHRRTGTIFDHVPSDYAEVISDVIRSYRDSSEGEIRERQEQSRLKDELVGYVEGLEKNGSIEAQEFRELIQLFGSERVVDILYQYHPEYGNIPVPYVKSIIADYLGDFLTTPRGLDLDALEVGVDFLFDSNLKDGLTEVVKLDCLRFYNGLKNSGSLDTEDLQAILDHIGDLRSETLHYATEELSDVFDEVESYYRLLFENINKPANLINELTPGRMFPDLNQRINIHEIGTKNKMLIADEMGVGKSASAILSKECLGVKLAVIVAPSNVIDTWQDYLSDTIIDGKQIGYFKAGQAPRVLEVQSTEDLIDVNSDNYDYILMSQERLNDRYAEVLEGIGYDMLILDEMHKLKNLTSGKRSEIMLRLAEQINGSEDKYLTLLSGTPIPNKVGDIAMVLKLLYPERFGEASNKELTAQIINGDVLDLRALLVPRMQMKSLAESIKMPDLKEVEHRIELSREEKEMYEVLLEEDELTASQKLQYLRKFNLNPDLLDATPDINGSKIRAVGEALRQTFEEKDKVVMFVNGYIEGVIRGDSTVISGLGLPEGVEVFTIEGEVEKSERNAIQQKLQRSNGKMLVLVSGQTADVGVDFSGAQEVSFYNEPWTEYDKKQQIGRVFRPGLSDDLVVRTFINAGTIEEGIHSYIRSKYMAVEKILRGIPVSDLEREMLKQSEKQSDPNLEVNPELAEYYFSSWDRMMKIYSYVKELGEPDFVKFLGKYGREYAGCYVDVGGRSYQANASRLSGTLIDRFAREKRKPANSVRILDVASGPEMLRRHIPDELSDRIVSIDINQHHFESEGQSRAVGSFLSLPISDDSVDYANLSLALHYSSFVPSKKQYERIQVLQELNRVLVPGGRAVITLMQALDLKDDPAFRQAVEKLGFRVVEQFSGKVEHGAHFRAKLFTLEKTHEGPKTVEEAVKILGPGLMKGFKFTRSDAKLRDSRKIATSFSIEGQKNVKTRFNSADQVTLDEEQHTQKDMFRLRRRYGNIKDIPRDEVIAGGLSRIFNGRSYVLFRQLTTGFGAVVLR